MKKLKIQYPFSILLNSFYFAMFVQYFKYSNGLRLIDEYVNNELYLGLQSMYQNSSIEDCVWHKMNDDCAPDISMILYADNKRDVYDPSDENWLRNSAWDSKKENVVLIHGYASGDSDPPVIVLRKAYVTNGNYNLFLVDYGKISRPPCYVSCVSNVPYISKCVGNYLNQLQKSGLNTQQVTCVGHSLGATICGVLSGYLKFQLNKIIALDPAWPLIFGNFRLSRTDAKFVHVLQTNAGYLGDVGSIGHVNVCVNGGLVQPYCYRSKYPYLCSHVWSLCYMSQSLFEDLPLIATKCSTYCPSAGIFKFFQGNSIANPLDEIKVINNVPLTASGTYCLDNVNPSYCPKFLGGVGDSLCCKVL